jgi:hypothetical protein
MHPAIQHDLAQAKIADLHRQAQRHALARTASRARRTRAQRSHPVRGLPTVTVRWVLTLLAGAPQRRIAVRAPKTEPAGPRPSGLNPQQAADQPPEHASR